MSDRTHALPTPEGEYFETGRFAGLSVICGVVGIVGVVLSLIGGFISPVQFSFSWLFGFIFYFTLCVGCLFWTIVHHVTDAEWSVVVRRQLENVAVLLPVLAVLFLPVLFWRKYLYRWMNLPLGVDKAFDLKHSYLNWGFFLCRAIFFFVALFVVAYLLRRYSVRQDKDGNPQFTIWMRRAAFIGLPVFALCLTFGAFDWLMSLNWRWFSTMWGPYIFAGVAGSSMALLVLITAGLQRAGYLREVVNLQHYHIMGKWLLSFTVFWAYIGFSQYMLYWYADIPEETQYYLVRNTESWNVLSWILVIGRFFLPFLVLLWRFPKKKLNWLCWISAWIILMQLLDMYIIVLPALHGTGVHLSILDFLPLFGIGGVLGFCYLRIIGRTSLFPVRDPRLIESLRLTN
ncbi:MAG TPA: hypothetical protein VHW03_07315 [Chthoniobacterales bacterium]|jgi:hypothetical protein|nr:hypothetical protein [Chthoniobacterales bacterium]